jgi:hypothetical protein
MIETTEESLIKRTEMKKKDLDPETSIRKKMEIIKTKTTISLLRKMKLEIPEILRVVLIDPTDLRKPSKYF